jgi:hypothetical protein
MMTDRELIERHERWLARHAEEISLLTKVQLEQHRMLRDLAAEREETHRHMTALAEAIRHLADRIGAAH